MIAALTKAVAQLSDPRFLKVLLMGIAGAIAAFVLLWVVSGWAVAQIPWGSIPFIGEYLADFEGTADTVAVVTATGAVMGLSLFLFPAVSTAIISLFLDSVCEAVEEKHYPNLGPARPQGIVEAVIQALKFLGLVIAINIVVFPFYLILFFAFGFGAILYYIVNGYLIGREFYELVAVRRLTPDDMRSLYKNYKGRITLFGVVFVFLMNVPILNLVAPVLAAAAMVHFFETLPRRHEYGDGVTVAVRGDPS